MCSAVRQTQTLNVWVWSKIRTDQTLSLVRLDIQSFISLELSHRNYWNLGFSFSLSYVYSLQVQGLHMQRTHQNRCVSNWNSDPFKHVHRRSLDFDLRKTVFKYVIRILTDLHPIRLDILMADYLYHCLFQIFISVFILFNSYVDIIRRRLQDYLQCLSLSYDNTRMQLVLTIDSQGPCAKRCTRGGCRTLNVCSWQRYNRPHLRKRDRS